MKRRMPSFSRSRSCRLFFGGDQSHNNVCTSGVAFLGGVGHADAEFEGFFSAVVFDTLVGEVLFEAGDDGPFVVIKL